jgi:hypothetical protein
MSASVQLNSDCGWNIITPPSHPVKGKSFQTRTVYIGSPHTSAAGWVAKIETCDLRERRLTMVLNHAEEIAYKIGKLFGWTTIIPKTKILHQFSITPENAQKYQKYATLMAHFLKQDFKKEQPITFTFQAFLEGSTLRNLTEKEMASIDLASFQKAFLLDMILGNRDSRSDNIVCNSKGEIAEIDCEYIAQSGYPNGVLHKFKLLQQKEITKEILDTVLHVTDDGNDDRLTQIRTKYKARDAHLLSLWKEEPISVVFCRNDGLKEDSWDFIFENFKAMKLALKELTKKNVPVTLYTLQQKFYEQLRNLLAERVEDKRPRCGVITNTEESQEVHICEEQFTLVVEIGGLRLYEGYTRRKQV